MTSSTNGKNIEKVRTAELSNKLLNITIPTRMACPLDDTLREIMNTLGKFGNILDITAMKSKVGNFYIGNRTCILFEPAEGNTENIPPTLEVNGTALRWFWKGCPKQCNHCKVYGHIRTECTEWKLANFPREVEAEYQAKRKKHDDQKNSENTAKQAQVTREEPTAHATQAPAPTLTQMNMDSQLPMLVNNPFTALMGQNGDREISTQAISIQPPHPGESGIEENYNVKNTEPTNNNDIYMSDSILSSLSSTFGDQDQVMEEANSIFAEQNT
ncbi:hypothetical protein AX774_g563 [Zancudomyces culisetae]|uniref:CCHC-type domain-containing protein n=1 Tax=Zancudomyces culisetae TaxID=1213189 RepID=A0A1R1PY86_ZANCU|nr:hypothetical protein AX774_g563 [Zancudomyces culisetae]|eukprot:OMH85877.1 hypothetical protein AX774_g563 [Zancudomyces culisetae]